VELVDFIHSEVLLDQLGDHQLLKENSDSHILFAHQQMHFLLNLENFKFT